VQFGKLFLPVHSFLFFTSACILIERPYMFPSFLLLSVAWIMLATQTIRHQNPSPWSSCPSFSYFLDVLRYGHSQLVVDKIEAYQNWKEAEAFERQCQQRLEKDQELAAKQAALKAKIDHIGDDKIHTKQTDGLSIALLERLGRYQAMLGRYCGYCRYVKIIVTWEESILSFWITAIFLAAGLVSLLLPWGFILTWTSRLFVWGLFGPHMLIVDVFLNNDSDSREKNLLKAIESFQKDSQSARMRRQDAVKLKDLKKLAFGEFSTLVPSHNLSRHYDRPLPSSTAVCTSRKKIKFSPSIMPGQQLFGKVIPRTQLEHELFQRELPRVNRELKTLKHCVQEIEKKMVDDQLMAAAAAEEERTQDEPSNEFEVFRTMSVESDPDSKGRRLVLVGESSRSVTKGVRRNSVLPKALRRSVRCDYEVVPMDLDSDSGEESDQDGPSNKVDCSSREDKVCASVVPLSEGSTSVTVVHAKQRRRRNLVIENQSRRRSTLHLGRVAFQALDEETDNDPEERNPQAGTREESVGCTHDDESSDGAVEVVLEENNLLSAGPMNPDKWTEDVACDSEDDDTFAGELSMASSQISHKLIVHRLNE
jgi:hypothetical protein